MSGLSKAAAMAGPVFLSGDPAADRRAEFAESLAASGDLDGAREVMAGALELAPNWVAGWYRLGEWQEKAGRTDEADAAWARCVAIDPADPLGAGPKRDLLRPEPLAESLPPAFVELLFDQYAPRFEQSLVRTLGYRGPQLIMDALRAAGFTRAGHALDLGCGTGLMGEYLRPVCDRLDGNDLSARMLAEARRKGVYDRLEKADIARLDIGAERYDLIVAADVFTYVGALEDIIAWCAGSLADAGWLAFTLERGEDGVTLRDSRRFAHAPDYVRDLLAAAGFAGVSVREGVMRRDRNSDIASLCVIASRQPHGRLREGDGEARETA